MEIGWKFQIRMIWGYSGGFVGRVGEIRARNGRKVVGKVALVESEAIEALAPVSCWVQ